MLNETLELIKNTGTSGSVLIIAFVIALTHQLLNLRKILLEASSIIHSTNEKKLLLLLAYIDDGINKKTRFSIEQAFNQHYRTPLSFDEISYLLDFQSPSRAIRTYIWGQEYLEFKLDPEKPPISLKPKKYISIEFKYKAIRAFLLLLYFFIVASFLLTASALGLTKFFPHSPNGLILGITLMVIGITAFWMFLIDERAISAAKCLLELQKTQLQKKKSAQANPSKQDLSQDTQKSC